jgi:hypothetical protein
MPGFGADMIGVDDIQSERGSTRVTLPPIKCDAIKQAISRYKSLDEALRGMSPFQQTFPPPPEAPMFFRVIPQVEPEAEALFHRAEEALFTCEFSKATIQTASFWGKLSFDQQDFLLRKHFPHHEQSLDIDQAFRIPRKPVRARQGAVPLARRRKTCFLASKRSPSVQGLLDRPCNRLKLCGRLIST